MTTLFGSAIQETGGGGLPSRESKRNRKTQALSALLSASALGVFLEGCSGELNPQSTETGGTGINNYSVTSRDNILIIDRNSIESTDPLPRNEANLVVFDTDDVGTVYSSSLQFTFTRSGENLVIDAEGIEGQSPIRVEIENYFLRPSAFVFAYNTSLTNPFRYNEDQLTFFSAPEPSTIPSASVLTASAEGLSDGSGIVTVIVGSEENDDLSGGEGADILHGQDGADTLDGEEGTDTLLGGTGADTYVFAAGDGADVIVEVGEAGVVNTLKFEGDYQASDFSFQRSDEDGTDLVVIADTDGDGQAENEVTLDGYFVSESSTETAYSIEIQINDQEAFVPVVEG